MLVEKSLQDAWPLALQGAVGRVFMTGKPEMSHNVQQFDKTQFLRVDEAQRCRVHSALFMPLYAAAARRHPFAVFEVVPADTDVPFPVLVQWLKCCLQVSSQARPAFSGPAADLILLPGQSC